LGSVACGCAFFGSTEGALCMTSERQSHEHEGGNWKAFHFHDHSSCATTPTKKGTKM